MYIYTPLCRYWIALYRYVLVFIVPHVDIKLEDNKQFISNIPRRNMFFLLSINRLCPFNCKETISWKVNAYFLRKIRKLLQNVICWNYYIACKELKLSYSFGILCLKCQKWHTYIIHAISHTVRQNLTEFWPFWTPFPIRFSKLTEFSYHLISYVLKNYK